MEASRGRPRWRGLVAIALGAAAALGTGCDGWKFGGGELGNFKLELRRNPANPGDLELVVNSKMPWIEVVDPMKISWEEVVTLRLVEEGSRAEVAVLGTYDLRPFDLHFKPVYPLLPGKTYVARFEPGKLPGLEGTPGQEMFTSYEDPDRAKKELPQLAGIFPSGDELPRNHLKFYLVFSEPMERGKAFDYLKLTGADGVEVREPFRETELWSEDGKRFTLWLHPGRQKEGVNLNVEMGPVLREGLEYRLVISGDWKAERGKALGKDVVKEFDAVAPDHARVGVHDWEVTVPAKDTRERLKIDFPEPYDWALLQSRVQLQKADGTPVEGTVEVGVREESWFFVPRKPWPGGESFRVAVDTVLEDLAGNNLARAFEVDLEEYGDGDPEDVPEDVVYVTFRIR